MYINKYVLYSCAAMLTISLATSSFGAVTPSASAPSKPVAATSAIATIQGVSMTNGNIVIKADAPIKAVVKTLTSPDRLVIDIQNAQLSMKLLKANTLVEPSGNVSGVRASTNFGVNPSTRLVVDMTSPSQYSVKSSGSSFTLALTGAGGGTTTAQPPKTTPKTTNTPADTVTDTNDEPIIEVVKSPKTAATTTNPTAPQEQPKNPKVTQSSVNPDIKNIAFGESYSDENPMITINAKDADIKDMLQMFADRANLNLIMDKSVAGNISLSINNMPFNEALNVLLKLNNLSAKKIGNTLVVAATAEFITKEFETPVAKSIKLNNAKVSDVANMIKASLPANSKATIVTDERTSSLLITGTQFEIDKAEAIIQAVDTKSKQVLIEVKLIDLSDTGNESIGTKFGMSQGMLSGSFNGPGGLPAGATAGVGGGIGLSFNSLGNLTGAFVAQLSLLVSQNKAKILASPIIATQENIPAKVDITDKIITGATQNVSSVTGVTTTLTTEEVGMKVDITPQISYDGYVTMKVHPTLTAKGDALGTTAGYAIFSKVKREAETTLRVKDGESIIIAGLKQTQNSTITNKVPFLGDIPWIGGIFTQTAVDKKTSDVLILVTPHIVQDSGDPLVSAPEGKKDEYKIPSMIK